LAAERRPAREVTVEPLARLAEDLLAELSLSSANIKPTKTALTEEPPVQAERPITGSTQTQPARKAGPPRSRPGPVAPTPMKAPPAETSPPVGAGAFQGAKALDAISPVYPPASVRRGEEGLVIVEAHVSATGWVTEARVVRSSSYPRLDRAALKAVRGARFAPARRAGRPVDSWVKVPIRFVLKP